MKILEITFHLHPGGAERFVVDLSNELAKTNDVTLLALRNDQIGDDDRLFYKDDIKPNVNYQCLGLANGLSPYMWWKIWKYINIEKPNVVHFHGDPMIFWMFIPILFSSNKVKFVQTLHFDFHQGGYDRGLNRIAANIFGRSKKLRYAALAENNYNDLKEFYPKVLSCCILNGRAEMTPTSLFEVTKKEIDSLRKDEHTRIFLHTARCNVVKNQHRLVTNFNRLVASGVDAHLLIIGDGFDEPLGLEVKKASSSNIHFLGVRKNISDYQLLSDVFCLSSDAEGMPISIIEALLSGNPVVCTPVCGALNTIIDGQNGILAEDFSDEAYLNALKRASNNYSFLAETTKRQKNNTPFSIKECANKYYKFFLS